MALDATGWSVIIGAISLGISQLYTTYIQNKRLDTIQTKQDVNLKKLDDTKDDLKEVKDAQHLNATKVTEIHEQTDGRLSELTNDLKAALNKIDAMTKIAALKEATRTEMAGIVERDKIRASSKEGPIDNTQPVEIVKSVELKVKK